MVANVETMMWTGEMPWHKKGVKVEGAQTSEQAIVAAGLNWKAALVPAAYQTPEGIVKQVPEKNVVVRLDNGEPLGIVGNRYTILQNADAFRFFDALVGERAAMYHTAGALGKGEKIWLLAKLPDYIKVSNKDVLEKYVLLANSHDGSQSVGIMITPIRVVCQNTLNVAIGCALNTSWIRHTQSMGLSLNKVRDTLGIINDKYALIEEASKAMTRVQVNQSAFTEYLNSIGLVTPEQDGKLSTRAQNILNEVTGLYDHGKGAELDTARGTLWGAFNAVAEYADFYRGRDNTRDVGLLYGAGAALKQRAFDVAMQHTG